MSQAPFVPRTLSSALVTVGLVSARTQLPSPGGQIVFKGANNNADNVHIEFGDSTVNAVVPTAGGGFIGGFTVGPGDMVELTPPPTATHYAYISLTAAQRLFAAVGADA